MRAIVDDNCTGCGLCYQICPEVFQLSDDIAEVIADPIPKEVQDTAQQAADECPVDAITIE